MMKHALLVVIILPLVSAYPQPPPTTPQPPSCPSNFTEIDEGCFFVESDKEGSWYEAENRCQLYNKDAHLATLNTQSVSTCVLYQDKTIHGFHHSACIRCIPLATIDPQQMSKIFSILKSLG